MNKKEIYDIFPTPIFQYHIEDHKEINFELEKHIYDLKKKDPKGNDRSNAGGWHSNNFDIINDGPPQRLIFKFKDFLKSIVTDDYGWKYEKNKARIVAMWAIINKKDSFNISHNHPNCFLSAAYYVKAPKDSGDIIFYEPNDAKSIRYPEVEKYTRYSGTTVNFEPEEGKLLIFPSYLYHSVKANKSNEDRIVISFNVEIYR